MCKQTIWKNFYTYKCTRKEWKDGFCKQHHPDTIKARNEAAQKKYEEKRAQDPLKRACNCITELKAVNQSLRIALQDLLELHLDATGTVQRSSKEDIEEWYARVEKQARAALAKANVA